MSDPDEIKVLIKELSALKPGAVLVIQSAGDNEVVNRVMGAWTAAAVLARNEGIPVPPIPILVLQPGEAIEFVSEEEMERIGWVRKPSSP